MRTEFRPPTRLRPLKNAAFSPEITPTPAAAPPVKRDDEADRQLQGVLKVVVEEQDSIYYVGVSRTLCNVTANASKAIHVRFNSVSGTTLLERIVSIGQITISLCN